VVTGIQLPWKSRVKICNKPRSFDFRFEVEIETRAMLASFSKALPFQSPSLRTSQYVCLVVIVVPTARYLAVGSAEASGAESRKQQNEISNPNF
jgi:hypothetical protein